jgi:hypothetical protein
VLGDLKLEAVQSGAAERDPPLSTVLAVLASLLRETTSRFERTSDRVAQLALAREAGAAVELIIAMQDFDRLRQDFDCIAGALRRCAELAESEAGEPQPALLKDIIAEIPVTEFRNRLLQCLAWTSYTAGAADAGFDQEVVF